MIYGYARVSTSQQNEGAQVEALKAAGCEHIRIEKKSGTEMTRRAELQTLLDFIREGDVIVVTRIDRIARSMVDFHKILQRISDKGAALKCTEQNVDMTTATGKLFLNMVASFAEFETDQRKERQLEGIQYAKKNGTYKSKIKGDKVEMCIAALHEHKNVSKAAASLGITRQYIHYILNKSGHKVADFL